VRRGGVWTCVDCGRTGTLSEINAVACPTEHKDDSVLFDAINGTGKFAPDKKS
jgi:hypothetical protein